MSIGVRPDRVRVGSAAASSEWRGEAQVSAVERLGDHADVTLQLGALRLVARCAPSEAPAEGSRCAVGVEPRDVHLFETEGDGVRVS
jgi:ABC-type sugar transport system ATPase subunit